jgi:hypothetical protein
MEQVTLFQTLKPCQRILLAGAGGGFDIFSGLPLYFRLKTLGHDVWLANYSFSDLLYANPVKAGLPLVCVGGDSNGPTYFPEKYLAQWLTERVGEPQTVYAFKKTGVEPLREAFQFLRETHDLDAIVLVDGGTDSLMRGDEDGLGTPTEDMTSLAALHSMEGPPVLKLLTAIGFGVDTFHGVCHHYFLEAVASLTESGDFLGAFSLLPSFEEAGLLQKVADYVHTRMPEHKSIVLTSILSACQGKFGDFHSTTRTRGSELYINPLMSLYWSFNVGGVAQRCLYFDRLAGTKTEDEVISAILRYRGRVKARPWVAPPF